VYRRDSHSALKHLWCESEVRVLQDPPDPKNPAERGVNISGDTLELEPHPEGHQLHVTGDLAQLEMGKIYITGPEIKIDQVANKAWVNGAGMLKMLSATTFSGDKLKEPQPMEIYWDSNMVFNGSMKLADFSGDIQAKQGEAHLMCQTLQVVFDRPISLREGNKDKDQKPAQVQNML
jgi:hypothetical protein